MKATGKVWVFYNSLTGKQTKPLSTVQAQMTLLSLKMRDLKTLFIWTPGWENWQTIETFLRSEQTFFVMTHPPRPEKHKQDDPGDITAVTQGADENTSSITVTETDADGYTKVDPHDRPLAQQDYGYYHQDFNGEDLDMSKIRKVGKMKMKTPKHSKVNDEANRRVAIRHNFKIEVVIIAKERTFRTYSKNISLGGTLLEDEIPKDFLNKPFDLIIINRFESDPQKRRLLFRAKIVGDITNPRRLMFMETDPHMMARLDALLKAYVTYQEQMKKQVG